MSDTRETCPIETSYGGRGTGRRRGWYRLRIDGRRAFVDVKTRRGEWHTVDSGTFSGRRVVWRLRRVPWGLRAWLAYLWRTELDARPTAVRRRERATRRREAEEREARAAEEREEARREARWAALMAARGAAAAE